MPSASRRRARALRLLYPISTPFTSLQLPLGGPPAGPPGAPPTEAGRVLRDTYSECYCLSYSLQHFCCSPNSWVWVGPAGAPPGGPRRLLRLLAVPGDRGGGPPGAAPCHCWRGALAVPLVRRAVDAETGCEEETEKASELPVHQSAGGPPPLFLPPHVLNCLGLTAGESEVDVWAAPFNSEGCPPSQSADPSGSLPSAFRLLPRASRCRVQQLSPPRADSWGPAGAPEGASYLHEAHELLNDYFAVPRLLSPGDVFAVPMRPFRYGAPCCGAPCNGNPCRGGGPGGGLEDPPQGAPKGCPCCLSLHEVEHAEAFGVGPPRCEQLASRVLFRGGAAKAWGPLFSEEPPTTPPVGEPPDAEPPQGRRGPSPPGSPADGPAADEGPPLTVRRRWAPSACWGRGAPCCHWRLEDQVYGCGHAEALHEVAMLFRVTSLEGTPSGGSLPHPQDASRGPPAGEGGPEACSFSLVVRGGTELMLQEAPGPGSSIPFGIFFVLRRPPLPLLPSLQKPFSFSCCCCPSFPLVLWLRCLRLSCGGSFLVRRLAHCLGLQLAVVSCHALAPALSEAAAVKGVIHCDGSLAPGGNSLFSAALVERASGGAPCVILLQHMGALMQDPGAPPSRLERLDSILGAHLRWFLQEHQQGEGPGGSRWAPVLVVGAPGCEAEGVPEGQLGPTLKSAFDLSVCVSRPDAQSREEIFRRLARASKALEVSAGGASQQAGEEFAQLTTGLTVADMRRCFARLLETAAEAAHARRMQSDAASAAAPRASSAAAPLSPLCRSLQLSPKGETCTACMRLLHAGAKTDSANIPEVTWADVGGMDEAKEQIRQLITLPLQHPKLFSGVGSRGGCLLFGPPGTGKTLLARAVATECEVNFFAVKGPELLNKQYYLVCCMRVRYIGESERNVRELFARAKACQPCVLFLDEIDALLPRRGKASDSGGVLDRVVAQVLSEMDALPPRVFPIGATNRIELVDGAALRAGRLERCVYVGVQLDKRPLLSAQTAKLVVRRRAPSCLASLAASEAEAAEVISEMAARVPPGFTGADCKALSTSACLLATKERIRFLKSLEAALSLAPSALQEAAVKGWALLDDSAPSAGCTYTATLQGSEGFSLEAPQVTLSLLATQRLTDNDGLSDCLQVWRGHCHAPAKTAAAAATKQTDTHTLWLVSRLPAEEAAGGRGGLPTAATLQLLLPAAKGGDGSRQQQPLPAAAAADSSSPRGATRACPCLLNKHAAAVWLAAAADQQQEGREGRRGLGEGRPSFAAPLQAYQGPPPCFVFAVHVLEGHFQEALRDLRPSVSAQDLKRYERMRDEYAAAAPLRPGESAAPLESA
ncbi:hypothetical protein Efla_005889 [Eimeria flavescens]